MEDVAFLRDNARVESYLFLADSSQRDKAAYPDPSLYEVVFEQPFRKVCGLTLVDATVARTEYAVPASQCALAFALADGAPRAVSVPPGDYTLDQLLAALNAALRDAGAGDLSVGPLTSPPELSNKVVFASAAPFSLDLAGTTLRRVLGFAPSPSTTTLAAAPYEASSFLTAFLGPLPTDLSFPLGPSQFLVQTFVARATGPLLGFALYLAAPDPLAAAAATVTATLLHADLDFETPLGGASCAGRDASSQPVALRVVGGARLVEGQSYALVVTCSAPNAVRAYAHVSNLEPGGGLAAIGGGPAPASDLLMCAQVQVQDGGYAVQSTGLVDLTGERYLLVRCPEIEAHMYRDRAFDSHHVGVGMVKLGGSAGLREQRFDFVNLPPRAFHAVERLGKLTLRLEKRDGSLYESNGVDNAFLFMIQYYGPQEPRAGAHVQNPRYDPDLNKYLVEHRWRSQY